MTSKYLIWIKVPSNMPQFQMAKMADILRDAFDGSEYGFFIVPDTFDALSRAEVKEWLESLLQELNIEVAGES